MEKLILVRNGLHEALLVHVNMLSRQVAGLSVCIFDYIRAPLLNRPTYPYALFAKTELADLICHTQILCGLLGVDFEETVKLGQERREEKQAEYERRHPGVPFI